MKSGILRFRWPPLERPCAGHTGAPRNVYPGGRACNGLLPRLRTGCAPRSTPAGNIADFAASGCKLRCNGNNFGYFLLKYAKIALIAELAVTLPCLEALRTMTQILLLNGPNLNLLGRREPELYGHDTLEDVVARARRVAEKHNASLDHLQTNGEAALIERIHKTMDDGTDVIIMNPGAFTHTSVALRDALLGAAKPFIEVHLSNVFAREAFRRHSYLSDVAVGVISGLGAKGYELAVLAALDRVGE